MRSGNHSIYHFYISQTQQSSYTGCRFFFPVLHLCSKDFCGHLQNKCSSKASQISWSWNKLSLTVRWHAERITQLRTGLTLEMSLFPLVLILISALWCKWKQQLLSQASLSVISMERKKMRTGDHFRCLAEVIITGC